MAEKKVFLSDKYKVKVTYKNGETKQLPVYVTLEENEKGNWNELPKDIYKEYDGFHHVTNAVKTYFVTFEAEESVKMDVEMPEGTEYAVTKPRSCNIKADVKNNTAQLIVNPGQFFMIEPNGEFFGALHIFCNRKKPFPEGRKNKIIFKEGIHTAENCEYIRIDEHGAPVMDNIPDDTLIYLSDGAVVNASIVLKGVKHVTVAGTGILSTIDRSYGAEDDFNLDVLWGGFRYYAVPNILIRSGCSDIVIEDVILSSEFRGITIRNSDAVTIRDIKVFASAVNGDGINCYNTRHMLVEGCYIRSSDDCFCMYNACDSIPTLFDEGFNEVCSVCSDAEVRNCILCSSARPVVLGGHATSETKPRCLMENIYIHDCEIPETPRALFSKDYEHGRYWGGMMRILSQSEQIVRNIRFENMTIDVSEGSLSQMAHICVRSDDEASYSESKGYRIENVSFKNINVIGDCENIIQPAIKCREKASDNDNCGVDGVLYENFVVGGKKLTIDDILIEGPVTNITVK